MIFLFLSVLSQVALLVAGEVETEAGPPQGGLRLPKVVSAMLGLKFLVAAGAAAVILWKCFYKPPEHEEEGEGQDESPCDISLEVVSGPAVKVSMRIPHQGDVVRIGRLPDNALTVSSHHVSGVHAHIFFNTKLNRWVLQDVGSMNGTKLNDEEVGLLDRTMGEEHVLHDGDTITLANAARIMVEMHPPISITNRGLSDRRILSDLKVAPRSGHMNAPGLQVPASLLETAPLTRQLPTPETVDLYFAGLQAEFAFISQVGTHHWTQESGSEDVAFWETPFSNFFRAGLFGVCDGHFGDQTSKELQQKLPKTLKNGIPSGDAIFGRDDAKLANLLSTTFPELDAQLESEDGSTATVLLAERLEDDSLVLQAANVGDSMGILIDVNTGASEVLTADHRVCSPPEKQRLKDMKIPLTHNETRAFLLNLARAMGDKSMKEVNAGLISEPHVSRIFKLQPNQSAVAILASDGLWDGVNFSEASKIVTSGLNSGSSVSDLVLSLLNQSVNRGVPDDITIALIRFLPIPK